METWRRETWRDDRDATSTEASRPPLSALRRAARRWWPRPRWASPRLDVRGCRVASRDMPGRLVCAFRGRRARLRCSGRKKGRHTTAASSALFASSEVLGLAQGGAAALGLAACGTAACAAQAQNLHTLHCK